MAEETPRPKFVVCVANDGCDDLTTGMIYRALPDETAAREDYLRVLDDSGEDYLYPASCFVIVEVRQEEEPKLLAVAPANAG
jgi:hypothetical protein